MASDTYDFFDSIGADSVFIGNAAELLKFCKNKQERNLLLKLITVRIANMKRRK